MNRVMMKGLALTLTLLSSTALANPLAERPDLPPPNIVNDVLEQTPAVQSAKGGIDLGAAQRRKWNAGPYEFTASGYTQKRRVKPNNDRDIKEWGAGLDRTFRVPGKNLIDYRIGDATLDAAKYSYGDAYHEQARELLAQWFDWLKARSEVDQWRAQSELMFKQRHVVATREKVGDAAKLEASIADAASAQAEASLKQAEARMQIAAATLLQNYPGLPVSQDVKLEDPQPVEGTLEEWTKKILEDNHELQAAQAKAKQARLQATRAKFDLIPDPTLGAYYGSEQDGKEDYVGLRLSIPLPASRVRRADSAAAAAEASIATQNEALTNRNVQNNIATVYAKAVSGFSSWQSSKLAAESIDQNAQKMAKAYELGEVGLTDLLNAQRLKAESALTYNTIRIEAIEARYRLLLDSHMLWMPKGESEEHAK